MCGIVFARRKRGPISKIVQKRYNFQSGRGQNGFGYIPVEGGKILGVRRAQTETQILAMLKHETAKEIMFHHRLPTSTKNYIGATHPIVVDHPMLNHKYYVIHNGVITNDDTLKEGHEAMGFTYTTEHYELTKTSTEVMFANGVQEVAVDAEVKSISKYNDSEALAIELALYLDGISKGIAARGSISTIVYQTDKEDNVVALYYGHNDGNPLIMERIINKDEDLFVLKSTGSGISLPTNVLYRLDYQTNEITSQEVDIGVFYKVQSSFRGWDRDDDKKYLPPVRLGGGSKGKGGHGDSRGAEAGRKNKDAKDIERDDSFFRSIRDGRLDNDDFEGKAYYGLKNRLDVIQQEVDDKKYEIKQWQQEASNCLEKQDNTGYQEACGVIRSLRDEIKELVKEHNDIESQVATYDGLQPSFMSEDVIYIM